MGLTKKEQREWTSLRAKAKRHHIGIQRTSLKNSNVVFSNGVHAQLGTGHATEIMDAQIKVRANRAKRKAASS